MNPAVRAILNFANGRAAFFFINICKVALRPCFAQTLCHGGVAVDVVECIAAGRIACPGDAFALDPSPVIGPDMDVGIIYFGNGMDALPKSQIAFAAVCAFAACRDHVVGGQLFQQPCRGFDPFEETLFVVFREGAGFVGDLPREDGRILGVGPARIAVRAGYDAAHVIEEKLLASVCQFSLMVLGHVFEEGFPAVASRNGIGAAAAPFEVL